MPSSRRSFIGGLLTGGAGLAMGGGITLGQGKTAEVRPKLIVPEDIAETMEDGKVLVASPEELATLGIGVEEGAWFGVPHRDLMKMSQREHDAWLHHHMEVNRSFGYSYSEMARRGHLTRDEDVV